MRWHMLAAACWPGPLVESSYIGMPEQGCTQQHLRGSQLATSPQGGQGTPCELDGSSAPEQQAALSNLGAQCSTAGHQPQAALSERPCPCSGPAVQSGQCGSGHFGEGAAAALPRLARQPLGRGLSLESTAASASDSCASVTARQATSAASSSSQLPSAQLDGPCTAARVSAPAQASLLAFLFATTKPECGRCNSAKPPPPHPSPAAVQQEADVCVLRGVLAFRADRGGTLT